MKLIIITGATGGIGQAISFVLARDGHDLLLVGRNKMKLRELKRELKKTFSSRSFFTACVDLRSSEEIHTLFKRKDIPFVSLYGLVNNAGVAVGGDIFTLSENDWNTDISVNLKAPFLFCQHTVQIMREHNNKGSIVNISSIAGVVGAKKPNYSSSKSGIIGLTKSIAQNVGSLGIRVNSIAPGAVDTEFIADWDEMKRKKIAEKTLVGRIAEPSEIAEIVGFLMSEKASFVTGTVINASGGQYLG